MEEGFAAAALEGRLDASTAGQFDAACASALESGASRIIVDMSGLEFISSAGLHSLLVLARQLDAGKGSVSCCGLQGGVLEVFSIAGFTKVFAMFDSMEQAVASVCRAGGEGV